MEDKKMIYEDTVTVKATTPDQDPALNPPQSLTDVYTIGAYGFYSIANYEYYATAATAMALARCFPGCVAQELDSTPELPTSFWYPAVEIPAGLLPAPGRGWIASQQTVVLIQGLPRVKQWALVFPANGFTVNAGYVAQYWEHNPPEQFPGLALKFATALLKGDGAPGL